MLSNAHTMLNDHPSADAAMRAALALDSHDGDLWRMRTAQLVEARMPVDAHQAMGEMLRLHPDDGVSHAIASDVYRIMSDLSAAFRHANMAVRLEPAAELSWAALCRVQLELGDTSSAHASARQMLTINPNSHTGKVFLGATQYDGNQHREAYETLISAVRENPDQHAVSELLREVAMPRSIYIPPVVRILALVSGLAIVLFIVWIAMILVRWWQLPSDVKKLVKSDSVGRTRVWLMYAGAFTVGAVLIAVLVVVAVAD